MRAFTAQYCKVPADWVNILWSDVFFFCLLRNHISVKQQISNIEQETPNIE